MGDVRVIGWDIANSVFQLHGLDGAGAVMLQKRLTRAHLLPFFETRSACLVGIKACATSHYWAREIARLAHEVKLMPAQYGRIKGWTHGRTDLQMQCANALAEEMPSTHEAVAAMKQDAPHWAATAYPCEG